MMRIRTYFLIDFTIFAVLVLLQALMHQVGIVDEFNSKIVIQYFIVSSILTVTERLINFGMGRFSTFVKISVVVAVAFVEVVLLGGMLMRWYTISTKWVLLSFALCIVITIILYFITGIFETKHTARQINQIITEKRKTAGDNGKGNME